MMTSAPASVDAPPVHDAKCGQDSTQCGEERYM